MNCEGSDDEKGSVDDVESVPWCEGVRDMTSMMAVARQERLCAWYDSLAV